MEMQKIDRIPYNVQTINRIDVAGYFVSTVVYIEVRYCYQLNITF